MLSASKIITLQTFSLFLVIDVTLTSVEQDDDAGRSLEGANIIYANDYHPFFNAGLFADTTTTTQRPFIDASTPTNVTVIKGKTAMLACVIRHVGNAAVSWMRLSDINVLAMNEVTNTKDKRIRAIHVPESDRWALRIQDTKLSDEGGYECQVTTNNKTIKVIYLNVLNPRTEILGPSEVFLSKGSTLNLTCVITNGPKVQPFVIWTHDSKMLKYVNNDAGQLTSNEGIHAGAIVTQIMVKDTDVKHSGVYQCEPGDAPTARFHVHVLDGKLPAAMQTAGGPNTISHWLACFTGLLWIYHFQGPPA